MYLSLLLLPIFGSTVAGLLGRKIGVTGAHIITCTCTILSAGLAVVAFYEVGLCGSPVSIQLSSWIDSELMDVSWGFMFDSLTVSMNDIICYGSIVPIITIGKRWVNVYKPIHKYPATNCTEVVVWDIIGSMGGTLGYKASHYVRMCTGFSSYHVSVLVGILLGDASITVHNKDTSKANTARVTFSQTIHQFPYVWEIFLILSPFCQGLPYINKHLLKTKVFYAVSLKTRSYAALYVLYQQFVVNNVKSIPVDIYNMLDSVALAH